MVKSKTEAEHQLGKVIKEKEQEIFVLRDKYRQSEAETAEKIHKLEAICREKEHLLANFRRENEQIGSDLSNVQNIKQESLRTIERLTQ